MSLPDEPVTRRPVFLPVLIAAVCLSIIGASFGYVLSAKPAAEPDTANAAGRASDPAVLPSGYPAPVSESGPRLTPPPPGKPTKSSGKTAPAECPERTQASVQALSAELGTVYQRLRVKTVKNTIAYICAADNGRLFYHGAPSDDEAGWNGENALFLPEVTQQGDSYVAKVWENGRSLTTITVTPKQWVLRKSGQDPVVEVAAD